MRWLLMGLCACACAQQAGDLFSKAPPDVEQALQAKVKEIYTLQQSGKWRAAERLVCDDSRDAYYEAAKTSIKKFQVLRVAYEDNFQKAKVTAQFEGELRTPHGSMPSAYALTSLWRQEEGAWCLYIPPAPKEIATPFGTVKAGETGANGAPLPPVPVMGPGNTLNTESLGQQILSMVKISKINVKLHSTLRSSDEIEIINGSTSPIDVSLVTPERLGLKITLSDKTVKPGKTAVIRLEFEPPNPQPKPYYDFFVRIEPFDKQYQVHTIFDLPESIKRQLPPGTIKDK
jgi:hypothetical protein